MSMVERLAERWEAWVESDEWVEVTPDVDARWWLNAIADELEEECPMEHWAGWEAAVAHLRQGMFICQAQEPTT